MYSLYVWQVQLALEISQFSPTKTLCQNDIKHGNETIRRVGVFFCGVVFEGLERGYYNKHE